MTSNVLLGAVLLALAVGLLLALLLPQTSAQGLDGDLVWQAEVQRRFGDAPWFETARTPLQTLGVFAVTDAAIFRLLVALLAVALLARLVDSAEAAWQNWRGAGTQEGPVLPTREEGADPDPEEPSAGARLGGRWPWGELGLIGIYLGSLMILAGAAIKDVSRWQTEALSLVPGESVPLGQNTDLTLRLVSWSADAQRGQAELWRGDQTQAGAGDLAAGRPLRADGVGVYLVGRRPVLQVQATLSETEVLDLVTGPGRAARQELMLAFAGDEPRHLVGVPKADLFLLLSASEADPKNGRTYAQVFDQGSGEFILEQEVLENTTLTVGAVAIELRPVPSATVRVEHDRGTFWIQLGALLLIAGSAGRGLWLVRRAWTRRRMETGRELDPTPEASAEAADAR